MLNPNLTVNDAAENAVTFNQIQVQGSRIVRRDVASSRQLPFDLVIDHSENRKNGGGQVTDRHLVQQALTLDVSGIGKRQVVTNLTIAVDRDIDPSTASEAVLDQIRQLCYLLLGSTFGSSDFSYNAFVEAILRGES